MKSMVYNGTRLAILSSMLNTSKGSKTMTVAKAKQAIKGFKVLATVQNTETYVQISHKDALEIVRVHGEQCTILAVSGSDHDSEYVRLDVEWR